MHRIDGPGATPQNTFTEGDPQQAIPATVVTDDFLNAVQEEIVDVILTAGLALSKPDNTQLRQAVLAMIAASIPDTSNFVAKTGAQIMQGPLELNAINTEVFANGGWITGNAGKGSLTWRGGDGAAIGRQWRWTLSDANYFAVLRDETGGTNRLLINYSDGETYAGAGAAFRVHHDGNTPEFESAELAIATGSTASASHGLGVRPRQFWMVLRCKIAEHTYNVGDELIVVGGFSDNGLSRGVTVWADASTVGWSSGNNIGFMAVQKVNGSGNSVLQLTNANWKSVLRANP